MTLLNRRAFEMSSPDDSSLEPVGEVIESTSSDFLAQACHLDRAPFLGTFVRADAGPTTSVFGVVAYVETAGIDPGARPIMRGHGNVRDETIYEENPDLPHVLRTVFRATIVGYRSGEQHRQVLPPRPPRLHYSVHQAPFSEVRALTAVGLDFLGALLRGRDPAADDVVAACIAAVARDQTDPSAFRTAAGKEIARLLTADFGRLTAILRRIHYLSH